jgi:hypothetical protein
VREWAGRHYDVVSVKRAKRAKRHAPKRATGLVLDREALKDACDLLGIMLPVHVRYNGVAGGTNGTHRYKYGHDAPPSAGVASSAPYHHIVIKSYLSAEEATSTLWHELTHAVQAERASRIDPRAWWAVVRAQHRWSYRMRPIEVEARAMAEQMKDCLLFSKTPALA